MTQQNKVSNILFTDDEHPWKIEKISFDFSGVTDPIPLSRAVFSSPNEWNWLTVSDILKRTSDFKYQDERLHPQFYEILECMKTMETIHNMIELYRSGNSHISGQAFIDLSDEVKAVELVKVWTVYANILHGLVGYTDKVEVTDRLVIKIARETVPTLFGMADPDARIYDDTKSVITQLSPYENNTKAKKEKKLSKDCTRPKNRIKKFLENKGARW